MPLFVFKCNDCEFVMEKFINGNPEEREIICKNCESKNCVRQFSFFGNRVWLEAKDYYKEKIMPEVKKISENMDKKDSVLLDVCGEQSRGGPPPEKK